MADLKTLGVRLALDDFGTGYCSLGYLRQFPIDAIKIDQSFVADLHRDAATSQIARAVTELAAVLGMTVTAEGVETAQQHNDVIDIRCGQAQGFHFARPMTGPQLATRLGVDPGRPLRLPTPVTPPYASGPPGPGR